MKIKRFSFLIAFLMLICSAASCNGTGEMKGNMSLYFDSNTRIEDVINDPVFAPYGRLLFPLRSGYYSGDALKDLRLVWYNYIDSNETVDILNYLKAEVNKGNKVFYDIYTEEEKKEDPEKRNTGLFFFRGNEGEKFAICNAGGGFAYVGAMHDSFPHSYELSQMGYNAFALIYRPDLESACEDLARAISFVVENKDELKVRGENYSLWGGSAGGRMTAYLSSYGPGSFGGDKTIKRPSTAVIQYTGHSDYTPFDPPTYSNVGTGDGIASWRVMQNRLREMTERYGIKTEFHVYEGLPHGFGLGHGTVAEGWIKDAVRFWEENSKD